VGEIGVGGFGCYDDEDDELSYSVVEGPRYGSMTELTPWSTVEFGRTNWSFDYISGPDYVGYDSITLKANDLTSDSDPVEIGVWIEPRRDDPPTCFSEPLLDMGNGTFGYPAPGIVPSGGRLLGLWHCWDDEGQPVAYAIDRRPEHGQLVLDATTGEFKYLADSSYEGSDEFALAASDGNLKRVSEPIGVTVVGAGSPPSPEAAPPVTEIFAVYRRKLLARGGFKHTFTAPAKGAVVESLRSSGSTARGVLAKGGRHIPHEGKFKVRVRLTRDGRNRLRRASQPVYARLTIRFRRQSGRLTRRSKKFVVLTEPAESG
jgi:hypothetical protein